jgi:2-polyprenyl-6-methoxyphenol hydroxylase-like FAD-dependent oxidoreductase
MPCPNGRAALAGDAEHVASPMIGGGFRQGLYDVDALARTASAITSPGEVPDALRHYQELRLGPAVRNVAVSERATAEYLAHAAARPDR